MDRQTKILADKTEHANTLRSIVDIALMKIWDHYPAETNLALLIGLIAKNESPQALQVIGGWLSHAADYPSFRSSNDFTCFSTDENKRSVFMRSWYRLGEFTLGLVPIGVY